MKAEAIDQMIADFMPQKGPVNLVGLALKQQKEQLALAVKALERISKNFPDPSECSEMIAEKALALLKGHEVSK